jgi:hypothetical protein
MQIRLRSRRAPALYSPQDHNICERDYTPAKLVGVHCTVAAFPLARRVLEGLCLKDYFNPCTC